MARALTVAILLAALALAAPATAPALPRPAASSPLRSALRQAVQFPAESLDFVTWDPVLKQSPNRGGRRWGTTKLVETTEIVLREYRAAHPDAPRVLIGDLSRRHGGWFGARYGGLGHASHQTGLDVDVYYPRLDRREWPAWRPELVDRALAQELVDRFVNFGALNVFVGPRVHLSGRRSVVAPLVHHDDHLHVRLSPRRVSEPVAG